MNWTQRLLLLVLTCAGIGSPQAVNELPGCGQSCYSGMLSKAASLGCPDGSIPCLCRNHDFFNGMNDCAKGTCATDLLPSVTNFANALCASATAPPPVASTAPPPPAPAAPTPTTSATSSATSEPAGSLVQSSSATSSSTAIPPTSTSSTSSTSQSSAASSSSTSAAVVSQSAAPTTSNPPSSITGSSSSGTPTAAPAESSSVPGLSFGAKVGVGVGAAAGGVALVALAVCIFVTRRHKTKPSQGKSLKISEPLPGSGRTYANDHHHQQFKAGTSDLETRSRRYEDMLPRQSPRTMV